MSIQLPLLDKLSYIQLNKVYQNASKVQMSGMYNILRTNYMNNVIHTHPNHSTPIVYLESFNEIFFYMSGLYHPDGMLTSMDSTIWSVIFFGIKISQTLSLMNHMTYFLKPSQKFFLAYSIILFSNIIQLYSNIRNIIVVLNYM